METKVEILKYSQFHWPGAVPFHIFKDLIYRENCSLDELYLDQVSLSMFNSKLPPIEVKNSSLKRLRLDDNNLTSLVAAHIAEGCKSLTSLDVNSDQISDLALFDKLLLGDDPKLQMLAIDCNPIRYEDFLLFLKMLPRMKSLSGLYNMKDLSILKSKTCRCALLEALWRNKSLERVCCYDDENDNEKFRSLLPVPCCWNRGGRR